MGCPPLPEQRGLTLGQAVGLEGVGGGERGLGDHRAGKGVGAGRNCGREAGRGITPLRPWGCPQPLAQTQERYLPPKAAAGLEGGRTGDWLRGPKTLPEERADQREGRQPLGPGGGQPREGTARAPAGEELPARDSSHAEGSAQARNAHPGLAGGRGGEGSHVGTTCRAEEEEQRSRGAWLAGHRAGPPDSPLSVQRLPKGA